MLTIEVTDNIGENYGHDCTWNATLGPNRKNEMAHVLIDSNEDDPPKFEVRIILSTDDPEELEQLSAILQGAARYGKMIEAASVGDIPGEPSLKRLMHPEEYDEHGERIDD